MKTLFLVLAVAILLGLCALFIFRQMDHRSDKTEFRRLLAFQPSEPVVFSQELVADLPDAARRYFSFAIAEGTPLLPVARIEMKGQFSLGTKETPNYLGMKAEQVLAAPHGFLWKMSAKSGLMRVSGSDSGSWTRFWLAGLAPVARMGGSTDHARSAFGRYTAEAAFWTPAALLPSKGVTWQAIDENRARFTMTKGELVQAVDISVDGEGRPVEIEFQRWSDANPEGVFQLQTFGGTLSAFETFGGYTVPTHVEAGNFFGTDAYFPFFIADVVSLEFPM